MRECFSIREKLNRKFGSNQLENKLDVDSVTFAHKLQDPSTDPGKGNARASTVNGKSIHGNPSDHRTAAVDVPNTSKIAGKGRVCIANICEIRQLIEFKRDK